MNYIKYLLIFSCLSLNVLAGENEVSVATQKNPQQKAIKKTLSDDEIMRQLIFNIQSLESNIKQKFKALYTLRGEERALLGVQILDLDKEITNEIDAAATLFLEIKQDGGEVEGYRKSLSVHLNRRNNQLHKIYQHMLKNMEKLSKKRISIEVKGLYVFEQKINKARLIITDILLAFQQLIEIKNSLGINGTKDVSAFSDLLLKVSKDTSSRLKLVSSSIKNKKNEISNSSKENKNDLELELSALNEKRKGISDSLSLLITLMDMHNLETSKLSQLLITSSGTINQQIFDKEVIAGLFVQWKNEFEKWLLLNASNFIVSSVLIILILILFRLISLMAGRLVNRAMESSKIKMSRLLRDFFVVSIKRLVMFVGVLIALSQAGVELGPLLAGIGVLGFVVGFALQGVLSNFASGLMILIYRPYDVGDVVEIAKVAGTVKEMSMVSTTMLSFNNEKLIIPNNSIWGSLIRNITSESTRRVDLVFKVSFDADIDQLERIFREEVNAVSAVLSEPAPSIELHKQHETHLEFIVRPWVNTADYWSTYWGLNKSIQKRMDKEGVPKLNPYAFLKPLINKV